MCKSQGGLIVKHQVAFFTVFDISYPLELKLFGMIPVSCTVHLISLIPSWIMHEIIQKMSWELFPIQSCSLKAKKVQYPTRSIVPFRLKCGQEAIPCDLTLASHFVPPLSILTHQSCVISTDPLETGITLKTA